MLGYPDPEVDPTDSSLEQQIDMAKMRGTNCILFAQIRNHNCFGKVTGRGKM